MKTILSILIALAFISCSKEYEEPEKAVSDQPQYRIAKQGFEGTWTFDLETQTDPNAIYATNPINLEELPNNKLLYNGIDTLTLISSNEYIGARLIHGSLVGGILTHTELFPHYPTQTSYYATIEYTR